MFPCSGQFFNLKTFLGYPVLPCSETVEEASRGFSAVQEGFLILIFLLKLLQECGGFTTDHGSGQG